MGKSANRIRAALLGASALALAIAAPAAAQERSYRLDLPAQPLAASLMAFGSTTDQQIVFTDALVSGRTAPAVRGEYTPEQALASLLAGTGLTARRNADGVLMVQPEGGGGPQSASAGGDVEALIVTAQKKEESIQDVPIAISAFSQKSLEEQKIEGGYDLMKAIPNVTFSKSNFTSYNFSIRGIGTKAVSATTDPGVAVAFNNSAIIQNRLFEQEYFDVERVEVLRGPQGTLYGRNATAGVINVISKKPNLSAFEGSVKAEVGNYDTHRVTAMMNLPIVEDVLAVRFAGALTSREGYDYNTLTQNAINGRDLWSGRVSIGFEPTERLRGNFIWERFEEDDDRSRTGKQLCHRDENREVIGNTAIVDNPTDPLSYLARPAVFSTGCKAGSLYDEGAFGTPNGLALPFILSMIYNGSGLGTWGDLPVTLPNGDEGFISVNLLEVRDPYGGLTQSRNLREIASIRDPIYRAKADVLELNFDFDLTDVLIFTSQTAYVEDSVYSFQDFNRFNTQPLFRDTGPLRGMYGIGLSDFRNAAPGGVFCDPQIGCTNRMAGFDISRSQAEQFTQEFRVASDFEGPMNFSLGANYTKFEAFTEYFVLNNVFTAQAMSPPFNSSGTTTECTQTGFLAAGLLSMEDPAIFCPYIDPNPVESINGDGHNYFRSVNPYKLRSAAVFGELYWQLADNLKLTAGLRYTDDRKTFTPIPTQLLLAPTAVGGGYVARGYPAKPNVTLRWGEMTGRIGLDWKLDLGFTDDTLVYGFYSRGYKGGGLNPPTPGFAVDSQYRQLMDPALYAIWSNFGIIPVLTLNGKEYGQTFDPEFVNAFEVGTKNTLMGGRMMLNAHAFYYDYKDYQVSQIRNRTAVNENFDAKVWGLEFETVVRPTPDLRLNANLGYLKTRVGDGEKSIDIMNRNLGRSDFMVTKSWMQIPANCVVPTGVAEAWVIQTTTTVPTSTGGLLDYYTMCGGVRGILNLFGVPPTDPATGQPFTFDTYPELNDGSGFHTDLSGNDLPNAPHWTVNVGAQYGMDLAGGEWRATVRGDAYWQSQSYHRVYNYEPYDKLRGWWNMNLSVWFERPDDQLKVELYAKNLLDDTPITDAFLGSDDSGLTTNVFTLDPRLIGLSVTKGF